MQLTFTNGVYVFKSTYNERHVPKEAGFWWHGGNMYCRNGKCKACKAGVGKVWWTFKPEVAKKLQSYADPAAAKALNEYIGKLQASQATDAEIDIPAPEGLEYYPFQKAGVAYAIERTSTIIGDEMGLGKTVQALGVVNIRQPESVLVVVPASLRISWLREAQKWVVNDYNFYVVENNDPVPTSANFVIVNYARLTGKNGEIVLNSLMKRQWGVLIVDECHYVRNKKAQRTKSVMGYWTKKTGKVDGLKDRAEIKLFLTGTPIMNRPAEIHSVAAACAPYQFGNFKKFGQRYCAPEKVWAGRRRGYVTTYTGASNLEELSERLRATCMVRRLKKDVLTELPAKRRQVIDLPLNGAGSVVDAEVQAFSKYESRLEKLQETIEKDRDNEAAYKAAVGQLNDVQKLAFRELAKIRHKVAVAKIPHVISYVDNVFESGTNKLVLFVHHHDLTDAFKAHWGDEAVVLDGRTSLEDKQAAIDRFISDDSVKLFIGSIGAAGTGVDGLQKVCSHAIFAELDWVPATINQAEDRIHRIGQDGSVLIQHLVFDGSIDSRLAKTIVHKQAIADKALDADLDMDLIAIPSRRIGRWTRAVYSTKHANTTKQISEAKEKARKTGKPVVTAVQDNFTPNHVPF